MFSLPINLFQNTQVVPDLGDCDLLYYLLCRSLELSPSFRTRFIIFTVGNIFKNGCNLNGNASLLNSFFPYKYTVYSESYKGCKLTY